MYHKEHHQDLVIDLVSDEEPTFFYKALAKFSHPQGDTITLLSKVLTMQLPDDFILQNPNNFEEYC